MTGWLRYPGQLAHLVRGNPQGVDGRVDRELARRVVTRVGSRWRTACGRAINIWYDGRRSPSAEWSDPLELRAERPRAFCLRCLYWAAVDALVLTERGPRAFEQAIAAGAQPSLAWPGPDPQ